MVQGVKRMKMRSLDDVEKEEIRDLLGKGWLTHDGMWFFSVCKELGVDKANMLNKAAIKTMAPFEAQRLKQVIGLGNEQLATVEDIRDFLKRGLELILPVSVFNKSHFSIQSKNVLHWEWEKNECFAFKGMSRIGVIDKYECGVMYRIECWFELLGLKFTANPKLDRCQMYEKGNCSVNYEFHF